MKTPIGATMYNFVSIGRPIIVYGYIRYEFFFKSTTIFFNGMGLKIIVLCSLRLE